MKINVTLFIMCILLQGCPLEHDADFACEKVMVCVDDRESYCDPPQDGSCVETCHYIIYEMCWEECKDNQ